MQLKTIDVNGATYAEVQDGKPVYVHEDGKVLPFDAVGTIKTINDRGAEARDRRIEKERAEARLKLYEGIDDPDKARKALEIVGNLDAKKLIDAGEVEKVKSEAKTAFERQVESLRNEYKPVAEERDALRAQLHAERLTTAFGRSKFIVERLAIPVDLVQSKFGASFGVGDDGKIHAKGVDGSPIYSRARPGEVADFDEALEILVDSYPYRDHILKGTGASGGGANGTRTGADGKRTVTMSQFSTMSSADQMKTALAADAGDLSIVD